MKNQSSNIFSWFSKIIENSHNNSYDAKVILHEYADFLTYKKLYEEKGFKTVNKPIQLPSQFLFSSSLSDVKKKLGKPSTVVYITTKPKLKIYLYKLIQHDLKIKLMFHFFNNQLVFVSKILPYAPNNKIVIEQNNHLKLYELPLLKHKEQKLCFKDAEGNKLVSLKNIQYYEYFIKNDASFYAFVKEKNHS